jgi:hypothetical protein
VTPTWLRRWAPSSFSDWTPWVRHRTTDRPGHERATDLARFVVSDERHGGEREVVARVRSRRFADHRIMDG